MGAIISQEGPVWSALFCSVLIELFRKDLYFMFGFRCRAYKHPGLFPSVWDEVPYGFTVNRISVL